MPKIIELLKRIDADVLLLQELDMYNRRTGNVDVCMEVAKALKMNFVYVVEYEELYSRNRTPDLQGGGVHGGGMLYSCPSSDIPAVLSKFPISQPEGALHEYQPFLWGPDHSVCSLHRHF